MEVCALLNLNGELAKAWKDSFVSIFTSEQKLDSAWLLSLYFKNTLMD